VINKLKPKSEFSRNVLTLMTGTTIAQAIPIAISPILTRLYTPEDFGVYSLYFGILSLFAVIATARYEIAIVLPKKDEDAINVLVLSVLISIILSFFIFIFIFLFKDYIINLINLQSVGNLLYLIPISLLFIGFYNTFSFWFNRKKKFKYLSIGRVIQTFTIGLHQIIFGIFKINIGMVIGNIIGSIAYVIYFILLLRKTKIYKLFKFVSIKNIIKQAIKYKDFPLINSIHVFSDVSKNSLTTIFISSFFGNYILGLYMLSFRILQLPLGIIGSSFGQVLYEKFNSCRDDRSLVLLESKKIIKKLFIIALPLFLIIFIVAPKLFFLIFGDKWSISGEYVRVMIPYLFINFLISPISQIPIIYNKQKDFFKLSLIGNTLFPLIFFLGGINGLSIINTLLIVSILYSIYEIYMLYWILNILKKED